MEKILGHLSFKRLITITFMIMPFYVWLSSGGNPLLYFSYEVPAGQFLYVLSKLFGIYAIFLLWLHISWTLLRKTPYSIYFPTWCVYRHKMIALTTVTLILIHVGLFVSAVSLRQEIFVYHLLLPNFSDGNYRFFLSLGVVALWLLPIIIVAGHRISKNEYLGVWVHRISVVFFVFIFFHGFYIGSETQNGLMMLAYVLLALCLLIFLLIRIICERKKMRLIFERTIS